MMSNVEAILQLQSLKEHCREFNKEENSIWASDIMALDIAIEALKQTPKSAIKTIREHCNQYNTKECDEGKCNIKEWCRRLEEDRIPEDWEV